MARLSLNIPESLPFKTKLCIRISDLNYGGHLGGDSALSLMHEARVRYLNHYGFQELDAAGAGLIMTDCAIQFRSEGFYGHDIKVELGAGDFSEKGFDIYYRFYNLSTQKIMILAKTGFVCFDFDKKIVLPVPEKLKRFIRGGPGE